MYDDDPHDHIDGLSERVRSCQAGLAVVDEYVQGAGRVTRPLRDYILLTDLGIQPYCPLDMTILADLHLPKQ